MEQKRQPMSNGKSIINLKRCKTAENRDEHIKRLSQGMDSWRNLENALSSLHKLLRNRQVGGGIEPPPPTQTRTDEAGGI